MKRKICELKYKDAVDAVKNSGLSSVMYKNGCWNKSELKSAGYVISRINISDYGADVDVDENGMLWVCTPSRSDMW